jgi:PAS domain S-box-containing protein
VCSSTAFGQAAGSRPASATASEKPLRTIIVPDYFPYSFINDKGMPDGFSVDLATAVVHAMDRTLEIGVDTWEHAREALEKGAIDFLPMMAAFPLREQFFDFSVPHTMAYDAIFLRKGAPRITSLDDLSGKTIILMNKDSAHDRILASPIANTIKLIPVDSLSDGLQLLASGKGDAAIMPKLVGLLLLRNLNIDNIEETPFTIDSFKRPFSFAVRKGNTALLESLSQGLSIVNLKGQYREIYDKWFGVLAPPGLPWKVVLTYIAGILGACLVAGALLLLWSLSLKKLVKQRTQTLESEIAVRKQTEAALRESEERFSLAMEATNDGVWDWNLLTNDVFRSPGFFSMLGFQPEEVKGNFDEWKNLVHPDDLGRVLKILNEYFAGIRETYEVEFRMFRKSGEPIWVLSRGMVAHRDSQGMPVRMVGTHTDITGRKLAEEALRYSDSQKQAILDGIPANLAFVNEKLEIQWVNKAAADSVGLMPSQMVGRKCHEFWAGSADPCDGCPTARALKTKKSEHTIMVTPDGRVWDEVGEPVFDDRGRIIGVVEIALDVTEMKQMQAQLETERAQLRTVVETIPDLVWLKDPDGVYLTCNPPFERFMGAKKADIVGKTDYEFFSRHLADSFREHDRIAVEAGGPSINEEWVTFADNGQRGLLETIKTPMHDKDGTLLGVLGIARNITAARKAEATQKRLATAIEQAEEAVLITDVAGIIQYVNPAAVRTSGYSSEELLGQTPHIFSSGEHDETFYRQLWKTIKGGSTWSGRLINKRKDGSLYHEEATISPVKDAAGKIVNFVAVMRDITEQVQLSQQLQQAQKMEAVGILAGGIAHDFNNILQVGLGYSELMLDDEEFPPKFEDDLRKVYESAKRGADLVQRLLTFSRKTAWKPVLLDLNRHIAEISKMLGRTLPKMMAIQLLPGENLAPINADPTQMDQVLINLALNARDSMPEGGMLTFETANIELDADYARIHVDARPGRFVRLTVADTGSGMDGTTMEHIFEPFYTTKGVGEGTGLGLAMVHGIVKQHGGHISCSSEAGRGTTFHLYFPALSGEVQPKVTSITAPLAPGTETVLLVDDEESVRELGSRILAKSGYSVLEAPNGEMALEIYLEHQDRIALIILDLMMPGMGGPECLKEILKINPAAKVLIASGYPSETMTKKCSDLGTKGFVAKPFNFEKLLLQVRRALDGG